jgi:hypothetical protein
VNCECLSRRSVLDPKNPIKKKEESEEEEKKVARGWRNNVVEVQKKFHDVEGGKRKKGERRRKRVKVPFGSTGYATGYSTVERVGWASGSLGVGGVGVGERKRVGGVKSE